MLIERTCFYVSDHRMYNRLCCTSLGILSILSVSGSLLLAYLALNSTLFILFSNVSLHFLDFFFLIEPDWGISMTLV